MTMKEIGPKGGNIPRALPLGSATDLTVINENGGKCNSSLSRQTCYFGSKPKLILILHNASGLGLSKWLPFSNVLSSETHMEDHSCYRLLCVNNTGDHLVAGDWPRLYRRSKSTDFMFLF